MWSMPMKSNHKHAQGRTTRDSIYICDCIWSLRKNIHVLVKLTLSTSTLRDTATSGPSKVPTQQNCSISFVLKCNGLCFAPLCINRKILVRKTEPVLPKYVWSHNKKLRTTSKDSCTTAILGTEQVVAYWAQQGDTQTGGRDLGVPISRELFFH